MLGPSVQQRFLNAIKNRDLDQIADLISAGADVNAVGSDPDRETPLLRAISVGDVRIVQALINAGADVNCRGSLSGWTPLMAARKNPVIMEALINAGADLNARAAPRRMFSPLRGETLRSGGETALHLAAASNNAEAVRLLVQAGANVEARAENGLAPLDYAVKVGSPTEAAVILVEAGAELTAQRLEQMHSGAHRADSDVWEFPSLIGSTPPHQKGPKPKGEPASPTRAHEPADSDAPPVRCPKCGALLYSRRSRICGNCNTPLPPELFMSDEQVEAGQRERNWARKLANAFSPTPTIADPVITDPKNCSPIELVRRIDCATQFRTRQRPPLLIYFLPALLLAMVIFTIGVNPKIAPLVVLPPLFTAYLLWRRANPVCPSCKQNVLTCSPTHCVVCGTLLNQRWCKNCSKDYHCWPFQSPFAKVPTLRRIPYCPGCGVFLDTWL